MNSLQLRPDKRSNMRRWFRKARGHHHSSRSLLSDALADSGASQGQETSSKLTRTYQVACFQEKVERFPCWRDLGNDNSISKSMIRPLTNFFQTL